MAVNTTTWEATLQTKLNDTTLTSKDMLLVGKTLEATTGNIAVSDVNTAGATQVAAVNSIATSTFKTVGGTSILGSGNIESLPAGGSTGQVVTNTGSGTGGWADAATPAITGIGWLEYNHASGTLVGLYGIANYGTGRAQLPFNHVRDPHSIFASAGSNVFTVSSTGAYHLEGHGVGHNHLHHTGMYLYNNTDNKFVGKPNAAFTGVENFASVVVGYVSADDPVGTQAPEASWLETGKTYSVRWSVEQTSNGISASTSFLRADYSYNGVTQQNCLMRAVITKLGGY